MKIKLKLKKISAYSALILGSAFFSTSAQAAVCTLKSNWIKVAYDIQLPQTINVKYGTPVGDVIYSRDVIITSSNSQMGDCPGPGTWQFYSRVAAGVTDTADSGVPGIGIRIKSKTRLWSGVASGFSKSFATPAGAWWDAGDKITVEVVKTSDALEGGNIDPRQWADMGIFAGNSYDQTARFLTYTPTKIIKSSCEIVGDANKNINFGTVLNKNLASITNQVVPGTEREITIDLKCNPGTKVSVTYDSINKDSYFQSSIINQGTAKGIYIHFPNIGKLGQENTVITSAGSSETIKQKVELYRSGEFRSGSISAQATYTLNYQ